MNQPINQQTNMTDVEGRGNRHALAYAAAAWAFVFAAMSFYWGLGGMIGVETLGTGIMELAEAGDRDMMLITWVTGILKAAAGVAVLALIQPWGRIFPRWLLRFGVWTAGILFTLYGLGNFVQHGLMILGAAEITRMVGTYTAALWHFVFWDPFWLMGGLLFILAARRYGHQDSR